MAHFEKNTEDYIKLLEECKNKGGLQTFEEILYKTTLLQGNIQEQPFIGSVFSGLQRLNWYSNEWKMPKARKNHECDICNSEINNGEEYVRRESRYDSFSYNKYCVTCASRYLLNVCECNRYGSIPIGYVCHTHWVPSQQKWIVIEDKGRTIESWIPHQIIPTKIVRRIVSSIISSYEKIALCNFIELDRNRYHPWLYSLLLSATTDNYLTVNEINWSIQKAINIAQDEGMNRWIIFKTDSNTPQYCYGCHNQLNEVFMYLLYGETTDFLCYRCASIAMITERTEWLLEHQESGQYLWDTKHGGTKLSTKIQDFKGKREEFLRYLNFQLKMDFGFSIDEIAEEENRKQSTIISWFTKIGVKYRGMKKSRFIE